MSVLMSCFFFKLFLSFRKTAEIINEHRGIKQASGAIPVHSPTLVQLLDVLELISFVSSPLTFSKALIVSQIEHIRTVHLDIFMITMGERMWLGLSLMSLSHHRENTTATSAINIRRMIQDPQ